MIFYISQGKEEARRLKYDISYPDHITRRMTGNYFEGCECPVNMGYTSALKLIKVVKI